MEKATFTVRKQYDVAIEIKAGDYVSYGGGSFSNSEGEVTYIFDNGKKIIVDDAEAIYTSSVFSINGVHVKQIEGEMTLI